MDKLVSADPPHVRLAMCGPVDALAKGLTPPADPSQLPGLLVSFVYLKAFDSNRAKFHFRDWVMDSGAFSAHNSGKVIDLVEFTELAKERLATDPQLTEVFSLDVIGDWRASEANTKKMWAMGVPAIPTWHKGEPWDLLVAMARDYPKIALGGLVGLRTTAKKELIGQAFARVWKEVGPTKIHGLGVGSEEIILAFPFHSVDATNWEMGPCAFGRWASFGGQNLQIRGKHNLRAEVEHYLRIEARARDRWKREMSKIEAAASGRAPNVRLALGDCRPGLGGRALCDPSKLAPAPPNVRLALMAASGRGVRALCDPRKI